MEAQTKTAGFAFDVKLEPDHHESIISEWLHDGTFTFERPDTETAFRVRANGTSHSALGDDGWYDIGEKPTRCLKAYVQAVADGYISYHVLTVTCETLDYAEALYMVEVDFRHADPDVLGMAEDAGWLPSADDVRALALERANEIENQAANLRRVANGA